MLEQYHCCVSGKPVDDYGYYSRAASGARYLRSDRYRHCVKISVGVSPLVVIPPAFLQRENKLRRGYLDLTKLHLVLDPDQHGTAIYTMLHIAYDGEEWRRSVVIGYDLGIRARTRTL